MVLFMNYTPKNDNNNNNSFTNILAGIFGLFLLVKDTANNKYSTKTSPEKQHTAYPPVQKPKKKKRKKLKGNSGIPALLFILGLAFAVFGFIEIFKIIDAIGVTGELISLNLLKSGIYFSGGIISFVSRGFIVRSRKRKKKYASIIGERTYVPIQEISQVSGMSKKLIKKELTNMIDDGFFGSEAYIDTGLDSLVLSPQVAEQIRSKLWEKEQKQARQNAPKNKYMSILNELRNLNNTIIDGAISEKVSKIEVTTSKIFKIVEEKPEKLPQIKRFMDYYLPTTLKLLRSYDVLEKQGIEGENITAAKQDISRILETLSKGYEQQLDQLFKTDVLDISSDIDVLESIMKRDGLYEEDGILKYTGSAGV